jgi:hypothetical protein
MTRLDASSWIRIAMKPAVVRRSLKYALIVGSVLVAINHGDALLGGHVTAGRLGRIALTMLVPYCVATSVSVGTARDAARRAADDVRGPAD